MKLRTSYSKLTTFKKNIFRFAPIWALYGIVMMLILLGQGGYSYDRYANHVLGEIIAGFGVVNLIYAALVAQALFGDLYNTRMCYALHSLPQRRESWLLSHLGAGLLYQIVPNLLLMVIMMARLQDYWFLGLYWLLAMTVQYLFFFGLASVSALLSGNRIAALAIYAGFNFVSMLAYATVQMLYIPTITGVVANYTDFSRFCPTVHLYEFDFLKFNAVRIPVPHRPNDYDTFYEFVGLSDGWGYTAIIGVVGLVAMGVSFWLYRIRHLESAGDFIAFPKLKGVMCAIMTVCVMLCFSLVGSVIADGYLIWMGFGLVIGFFGSLMLLERRIKVFRKKTLLGFGLMVAAVALSMTAVACDWLGIESWTPNASRVESVTVSNGTVSNSYYNDYYGDRLKATLTEEADIAQIIKAHQDILDHLDFRKVNPNAKTHRVTLVYTMKSGRTVTRTYSAPASGVNYEIVNTYLYTKEAVLGFRDVAAAAEKMDYMYLKGVPVPETHYVQVLEALVKDFEAGKVSRGSTGDYYLEYAITEVDGTYTHRTMHFGKVADALFGMLTKPEWQMGYENWEEFLEQVTDLSVDGQQLTHDARIDLLEAMRKDVEAGTLMAEDYKYEAIFYVEYSYHTRQAERIYRYFAVPKYAENTMAWYRAYLAQNETWNPEGV